MTGGEHKRMAEDDIDLDRVIVDPTYRRHVIEQLRAQAERGATPPRVRSERAPMRTAIDD
jgi:hypothetical protein